MDRSTDYTYTKSMRVLNMDEKSRAKQNSLFSVLELSKGNDLLSVCSL